MAGPFFTSDLHLGHDKIIAFDKRPFVDLDDMHAKLVDNWNNTVTPKDDVFILGDLSFLRSSQTKWFLDCLNGNKHLIKGNHDRNLNTELKNRFVWVKDVAMIKVPDVDAYGGKQLIWLSHYAHQTWDRIHYGTWHCFGHSHGNLKLIPGLKYCDVSVKSWNWKPASYQQIKEYMSKITFIPQDHHGARNDYGQEED